MGYESISTHHFLRQQSRHRRNFLSVIFILKKRQVNIIAKCETLRPSQNQNEAAMSTISNSSQHYTVGPSQCDKARKINKSYKDWKQEK